MWLIYNYGGFFCVCFFFFFNFFKGVQIIGILALYEEAETEQIMCRARQLA